MNWPTFLFPDPKTGPETWSIVKHPRDRGAADVHQCVWYLRPPTGHPSGKSWHSLGTADQDEAIRRARAFLCVWSGTSDRHQRAQAELAGPAKLTVGDLCDEWATAGYPDADERPRSPEAAKRMQDTLSRVTWWHAQDPALITRDTIREYARHRRGQAARRRGQTGDRAIDLELAALSCLCQWAVSLRKINSNPFADRQRFRRSEDVEHCNEFRPACDEELHAILGWMWAPTQPAACKVAGAALAWSALTGQRPGEYGALRTDVRTIGDRRPPGTRWTMKDGSERIAVDRAKGGINPAVRVHPALAEFLAAWLPFAGQKWPQSPWYFPDPEKPAQALPQDRLRTYLESAVEALGLPERHPHAMRAFYVRVRRSDGVDDGTIAVELGQGSGPGLIVRTYGRCDDILGDGAFDWLPDAGVPAWAALRDQTPANVVSLNRAA